MKKQHNGKRYQTTPMMYLRFLLINYKFCIKTSGELNQVKKERNFFIWFGCVK